VYQMYVSSDAEIGLLYRRSNYVFPFSNYKAIDLV
jgi:hypothetical protein